MEPAQYQKERNNLLKSAYSAKDPQERQAIEQQILQLDQRYSESRPSMLNALDVPLQKTKEFVSGDPQKWFDRPAGMSHEAWAASQVAGDLLLDPLNAVGGPLAKATKGVKQLPGAVASLSNFIPDWYGPSAVDKATGFMKWATDSGTTAARHMLDPVSRANWTENAVTGPAQQRVRGFAESGDVRGPEKAVSQVQYTSSHIPTQTGGKRSSAPAADEIHRRSFLGDYEEYTPQSLSNALQGQTTKRQPYTGGSAPKGGHKSWKDAEEVSVTPAEADHVAQTVNNMFKGEIDNFIIKSPGSKETGGHYNDVIYKNPAKDALRTAFEKNMDADGNVNPQQLADWLNENHAEYMEKLHSGDLARTRDSWRVTKVDDDGVWLTGSMLGSAITEGGIGWTMKVAPDGTMKGFMMDKHDFFEKYGAERVIPGKVVAVTPSMTSNIKYVGRGNKKLTSKVRDKEGNIVKEGRKHVTQDHTAPYVYRQTQYEGPKTGYQSLFEDYANIKPSAAGVRREAATLGGQGLLAERLYSNTQGEN